MASLKLGAADAWLTGLKLSLLRGDSKPESILLSELLELSGRLLRGSSIAALNDHGLTLIDNSVLYERDKNDTESQLSTAFLAARLSMAVTYHTGLAECQS